MVIISVQHCGDNNWPLKVVWTIYVQPSMILLLNSVSNLYVENTNINIILMNWLCIILEINNYLTLFHFNFS